MFTRISTCSAAATAAIVLLLAPSSSASQSAATNADASNPNSIDVPASIAPLLSGGIVHDTLLWDEPGDGSVWARGATYKVGFDADGATYYPAFGARAPHNMPHALSPDALTVGGRAIPFERAVLAAREGEQVRFDRGPFVEVYDVALNSIEQSFVFRASPGAGDLVLHIPVGSELEGRETESELEFRGEFGRVTYSRAIAIDARGRRVSAPTSLVDGAITIRVAAEFLASAAYPLVIDPVVGTIQNPGMASDDFSADVSFDDSNQIWLVVWEQTFSATDTDVYCRSFDVLGAPLTLATIDFTSNRWDNPRCANNNSANQFLVVAAVTSGATKSIQARTVTPSGPSLTLGTQFTVSGADVGDKVDPDVGADSFVGGSTYYCIVYTRTNPGGHTEIGVSLVLPNQSFGPAYYLPGAGGIFGADDTQPSVAKSTGGDRWLLAWRRRVNVENGDIYAAHVNYLGALLDGPFAVTPGTLAAEMNPCASSPLSGSHRAMIAYESGLVGSTNRDIHVAEIDGASVLATVNLNTLEGTGLNARDQIEPSVDCDGRHFLVAYSEFDPTFLHYNVFATDVYLAGTTIGIRQARVLLQNFGLSERRANVAARHHTGLWDTSYAIVYDFEQNSTDHDVFGNRFEVLAGGSTSAYCFGDSSGTACPCGNSGGTGRGCANSTNASGALLETQSGVSSTFFDSLVIRVTGVPSSAACLFFQGSTLLAGNPFGDGLQCAGGSVVRLATRTASAGSASYPVGADQVISQRGGIPAEGARRGYQVWYRNAAAYCTASTFNLSNGLQVDWAR